MYILRMTIGNHSRILTNEDGVMKFVNIKRAKKYRDKVIDGPFHDFNNRKNLDILIDEGQYDHLPPLIIK